MNNLIPGTVCCILCRGMVIYKDGDKSRFKNHMNNEHGAFFDIDYLLASCLMESGQKEAVAKTVNANNGDYSSLLLRKTSVAEVEMTLREETLDNRGNEEDDNDEVNLSATIELKKEKMDEFDIDLRLKCVNCEVQFGTQDGYIQHERKGCKKEEVKKKNVECEQCGKYYTSKQSLRAHKEKYHNNEPNIKQERFDDPSMDPKLYPRFSSEERQTQVPNQEETVLEHSNYDVNVSNMETEEFLHSTANESYASNNFSSEESEQVLDQFLDEARKRNPNPNMLTPVESEKELDQLLSEVRKRNGDVLDELADDNINSEVNNEAHNKRENSERFVCQVENCGKSYTVKSNKNIHEKKVHNIVSTRGRNKKQKVDRDTPTPEENKMKWDELEKIRDHYYNTNESDRRSVSNDETFEEDFVQQKSNEVKKSAELDLEVEAKVERSLSQSMGLNMTADTVGNQSLNILPGLDISMSKYFTRNPKVITSARGKSLSLFNEVPNGLSENWKMRTFEVINNKTGDKQVVKHYLTPELKVLKTGLAVIEYLRLKEEMNPAQLLEISTKLNIPEKKLRSLTD